MARGTLPGVEVAGGDDPRRGTLPAGALALLAHLERESRDRRSALQRRRHERQATYAAGLRPAFATATARLREGRWTVTAKRVAFAPLLEWPARHGLVLRDPALFEPRVVVDGRPVCAALHDLAAALCSTEDSACIVLPGLESHLEARLWAELLRDAAEQRPRPGGALTAIVRVETLPALFELDEILWELSPFATALELDLTELRRSVLQKLGDDPAQLAPDLGALLELQAAPRAALQRVAAVAQQRGVASLLAARQPIPLLSPDCDSAALASLCTELSAAAATGFDGVAIGDPMLRELAERRFVAERAASKPSAADRASRDSAAATPAFGEQLLEPPTGERSRHGLEESLATLLQLEAAAPAKQPLRVDGRLETPSSGALRHAQVAQWIAHRASLADGPDVTPELVRALLEVETEARCAEARARPRSLALRAAAERLAERLALPR